MKNPLQRLYTTKMALLATILTATGIVLLLLNHLSEWAWVRALPIKDLGSILFTTGMIAILLDYIDAQDADHRATQRLRNVFTEQAPALRDSVISGFAATPDDLTTIASPETMDAILLNTLTARLADPHLAHDVYTDLHEQVIEASERHYDTTISVTLSPSNHEPLTGFGSFFIATIRYEYRATTVNPTHRFWCVPSVTRYRELLRDPTTTGGVWLFEPTADLNAASPEVFDLAQFTVDGIPQPIRHTTHDDARVITVDTSQPPHTPAKDLSIGYTYRTLATQHGHLLFLDINTPTKKLQVDLNYGGCGIRHVNVLDFISSPQQPRITRSPDTLPTRTIGLAFDGWCYPKSGVAFIWTLDREVAA